MRRSTRPRCRERHRRSRRDNPGHHGHRVRRSARSHHRRGLQATTAAGAGDRATDLVRGCDSRCGRWARWRPWQRPLGRPRRGRGVQSVQASRYARVHLRVDAPSGCGKVAMRLPSPAPVRPSRRRGAGPPSARSDGERGLRVRVGDEQPSQVADEEVGIVATRDGVSEPTDRHRAFVDPGGVRAARIEEVGTTAGHAGAEVRSDRAEHDHDAAGHVLAAVRADALDDRLGATVADGEALPGSPTRCSRPAVAP